VEEKEEEEEEAPERGGGEDAGRTPGRDTTRDMVSHDPVLEVEVAEEEREGRARTTSLHRNGRIESPPAF